MGAAAHRHCGAEKDQPHERGARHFVIPDKSAPEHIAGIHADQEVDRDDGEEEDAEPLHPAVQDLLQGPHFAAARTLSSHSLPTFAPTSWYTGPIMSRKGRMSPMSFTLTPALRMVARSPASLSTSALRSSAHVSFAAASTTFFRSADRASYLRLLANQVIGS